MSALFTTNPLWCLLCLVTQWLDFTVTFREHGYMGVICGTMGNLPVAILLKRMSPLLSAAILYWITKKGNHRWDRLILSQRSLVACDSLSRGWILWDSFHVHINVSIDTDRCSSQLSSKKLPLQQMEFIQETSTRHNADITGSWGSQSQWIRATAPAPKAQRMSWRTVGWL